LKRIEQRANIDLYFEPPHFPAQTSIKHSSFTKELNQKLFLKQNTIFCWVTFFSPKSQWFAGSTCWSLDRKILFRQFRLSVKGLNLQNLASC